MPHKVIYSRFFLERVYSWDKSLRDMAFQAAEHAALDPNHTDYSRAYLTPFKQKHPSSDHQYTLYFEIINSPTSIFVCWINDDTCLHDTRMSYGDDPCLKEFNKVRTKNNLETYDPKYHNIQFEVHPDKNKPIRCRSRLLGEEIQVNTFPDSSGGFIAHAFNCTDTHREIALKHVKEFLNCLHDHLSKNKIDFKFCIYKVGQQAQIDQLTISHDSSQWQIIDDQDDFIMMRR